MPVDELLRRCLEGDSGARNDFVDRCAPVIHAAVRRLIRGRVPQDRSLGVEDIVQEVFLRLFKNDARLLRTHDPNRGALSTWLTIVARSTTLSVLRKKRPASVPFEPAVHSPAVQEPGPSAPDISIPDDLLAPRQRLVMQLLYGQGRDVREVARILGVEEQTVRSARHKALSKLRAFFGRDGKGPER